MLARDVMVSPVITVGVDANVRDIAKTLLENRISAVPVIDGKGKLAGIVTESDLMHRVEAGTERRHSWWLEAFQGNWTLAADYVKSHSAKVADVMTHEVVTASPETPLHEIAALLESHQIKRVPIMSNNGELVGIVSRANLLQAVATAQPKLDVQLPDAAIRQKIMDHLKRQRWAHAYNLNVTVANGVVDLWGVVESEAEKKALHVAAENVPGVATVNDHLLNRPLGWQ
jgi:CBS-domain-containing membrane protein